MSEKTYRDRMLDQVIAFFRNYGLIQRGDYILSGGIRSDTYINVKGLMLHAEMSKWITMLLFSKLIKDGYKFGSIGGTGCGGALLVGALLHHVASYVPGYGLADTAGFTGFIVRREEKPHGNKMLIEGPIKIGMRCVIVEDVTTTGKSILYAIKEAKKYGLEVVAAATVVNRQEGADELMAKEGIPFVHLLTKADLLGEHHEPISRNKEDT